MRAGIPYGLAHGKACGLTLQNLLLIRFVRRIVGRQDLAPKLGLPMQNGKSVAAVFKPRSWEKER